MINTNHNLSSWLCPWKYCITVANCQSDFNYSVIVSHSLSVRWIVWSTYPEFLGILHFRYKGIFIMILKFFSECYWIISDKRTMSKVTYNDCLKNGTYVGTFVTGNEQNILLCGFSSVMFQLHFMIWARKITSSVSVQ